MRARIALKRPIDRVRESAGSAEIGDDGAPIVRPVTFADTLYMVTTTSVYRVRMADDVDPKRENINVPWTVQQKIIPHGADKEFVRVTFIAASELLTKIALGDDLDIDGAMRLALENAIQLSEIFDTLKELQDKQDIVEKSLAEAKLNSRQFAIPHTQNLRQRGDHLLTAFWRVALNLIQFAEIFYPKPNAKTNWQDNLKTQMLSGLPQDHELQANFPIMIQILDRFFDYRHAFTHPNESKSVTLFDYDLTHDLTIWPPSIEIRHPKNAVHRTPLIHFLDRELEQAIILAEEFLFWLCELNAKQRPAFEHRVVKLAEDNLHFGSPLRWHIGFKLPLPPQKGSISVLAKE